MSLDQMLEAPQPEPETDLERPRKIDSRAKGGDAAFALSLTAVGWFVVTVVGLIGLFLGYQLFPTIHHYGFSFFTTKSFEPGSRKIGILAAMVGTIEIAIIALIVAFPLALCTALYITEYSPRWARSILVSTLDLLAAVPSVVWAALGFAFLVPNLTFVARWLNQWFGWMPWFSVKHGDPSAANFVQKDYTQSAFTVGVIVALMVIPIAASVMRNVFSQAPIGEREAAAALGATNWGVIRTVVLPFGRGGIIGGTMLGLGRALGETIAVTLTVSLAFDVKIQVLANGAVTISQLVANDFADVNPGQLHALLAAGFVLFLMVLIVNTLAGVVISRSRSGADT